MKQIPSIAISVVLAAGLTASLPASSAVNAEQAADKKQSQFSEAERERARQYFTDTELTTHEGKKVRFYSDTLDGNIVVINVMYTSCKGACPLMTQKLVEVSEALGDAFGSDIQFVSISNDPETDTPEALAEFAAKQRVDLSGWTFLTGSKPHIDAVLKKIGLYTPIFEQHKALVLLGNTRNGHWQKVQPNLPAQAIVTKLNEVAGKGFGSLIQ